MVKRKLYSPIEEATKDMITAMAEDKEEDEVKTEVEVKDVDVVPRDSTSNNMMFKEKMIEVSIQEELEELKITMVVRTGGNKIIIKAMNVTTVARRDIMQGITGPRKLKEIL